MSITQFDVTVIATRATNLEADSTQRTIQLTAYSLAMSCGVLVDEFMDVSK